MGKEKVGLDKQLTANSGNVSISADVSFLPSTVGHVEVLSPVWSFLHVRLVLLPFQQRR